MIMEAVFLVMVLNGNYQLPAPRMDSEESCRREGELYIEYIKTMDQEFEDGQQVYQAAYACLNEPLYRRLVDNLRRQGYDV